MTVEKKSGKGSPRVELVEKKSGKGSPRVELNPVEILGMAFAKKAMGQKLTAEEEALLLKNSQQLAETVKTVKSENKAANDAASKAKLESHTTEVKTFAADIVAKINTYLTGEISGAGLKTLISGFVKQVPVLKGTKAGTSTGMTAKIGKIKADGYAGICKATLLAAKGKPVAFTKLAEAVHKAKPESAKLNAAGKEPLSTVYIKRVTNWFPNVTQTGKGTDAVYTWPE